MAGFNEDSQDDGLAKCFAHSAAMISMKGWALVWLCVMQPWPIKVVGFNPLNASSKDRLDDIGNELNNFDVILLNGTGIPNKGNIVAESFNTDAGFKVLHSGWDRTSMSNKSAGVSIMWGKRFRKAKFLPTLEIGGMMQGRAIASRAIGGYFDFTAIAAYFPPIPESAKEYPVYRKCCNEIVNWVYNVLKSTPSTSTPILYCDVNDGIGKVASIISGRGCQISLETNAIAEGAKRLERLDGGAGELLRPLLDEYALASLSSWSDYRDTFYGNRSSSLLDHVFMPIALAPGIRSSGVLMRAGRRLQLIKKRTC